MTAPFEAAPLTCGDARIPVLANQFIPHISRTVWFSAVLDRCAGISDGSPTGRPLCPPDQTYSDAHDPTSAFIKGLLLIQIRR